MSVEVQNVVGRSGEVYYISLSIHIAFVVVYILIVIDVGNLRVLTRDFSVRRLCLVIDRVCSCSVICDKVDLWRVCRAYMLRIS